MNKQGLNRYEYSKILKFIDSILVPPEKIREQVLFSLANIFGYNLCTFWLADSKKRLFSPMTFSVHPSIMDAYENKYYSYDPFYPPNLPKKLINNNAIHLQDITDEEAYKENKYYKDILSTYKYLYKTIVLYKNQGKVIGCSSLLRSTNSKNFNHNDLNILDTLAKFISRALANALLQKDINYQNRFFQCLGNHSAVGLIVFDKYFKIHYYNPAALEFCAHLTPSNKKFLNPIEGFINAFLIGNKDTWKLGMNATISSASLNKFFIQIVLNVEHDNQYYLVYIYPKNLPNEKNNKNRVNYVPKLTPREQEILDLVIKGLSNQEIANELFITVATTKSHIQNIFKKLDVTNRTSLCYKINSIAQENFLA